MEAGKAVIVTVKPERVGLTPCDESQAGLCGNVVSVAYLGSVHSYVVAVDGEEMKVRQVAAPTIGGQALKTGDRVSLKLDSVRVLEA